MKVSAIKTLIEKYAVDELKNAENNILSEQALGIEVEGEDAGEQLTHLLAAIYCKEEMQKSEINLNMALRQYSQRVRDSIN